jgi:hypothetical protein
LMVRSAPRGTPPNDSAAPPRFCAWLQPTWRVLACGVR